MNAVQVSQDQMFDIVGAMTETSRLSTPSINLVVGQHPTLGTITIVDNPAGDYAYVTA